MDSIKFLMAFLLLVAPISAMDIVQDLAISGSSQQADISSTNTATLNGDDVSLTQSIYQMAVCDGDVNIDATNIGHVTATSDATVNQGVIQNVMGYDVVENGANWADVFAGEVSTTSQAVTQGAVANGVADQTAGNILFSDAGVLANMNGQLVQMGAIGEYVEQNGGNILWSIAPAGQVGQTAILGAVSEIDAIQNADNWANVCMDNAMVGQGAFVAGEAGGDLSQDAANLVLVFGDNPIVGQYIAGQGVAGDQLVQYLSNNAAFVGDGGMLAQHTETVAFGDQVYQFVNNNWV
jgi:hypothetical protein